MSTPHRLYGADLSPYSVKVRSYLRYKDVPHEWIGRGAQGTAEYQKLAKIPIIPLLVTPEGEGLQDSTPIMEWIDARFPEPSTHPADPAAAFVSRLLEEFADEWANKWMFHLRWARDEDQKSAAGRIAAVMAAASDEDARLAIRAQVIERMLGRLHFVGSNEETAPLIESSFREAVDLLEVHLQARPYLFGARPAFADFGLWGQLYCAWTDPTAGAWIASAGPNVVDWIHRMLWPGAEGEFEPWEQVEPTLAPLLERSVGALFCPWTLANAAAIEAGRDSFSVELGGQTWTQAPQKYHAKSLATLRERYVEVDDRSALDPLLERCGCLLAIRG
jgi:glutathione S-transferase